MVLTLTTDFGTRDGFVAQMKGVVLQINPSVRLIDVTHDIEPYSVLHAALVLKGISRYFPAGTIHIAVVDPGVGSDRRGMALKAGDQLYVGPDNGLFSLVLAESSSWEARRIENTRYMLPNPHPTFHGRDVFAPVAAHLSAGKTLESVGTRIHDPVMVPVPSPVITEQGVEGEVIHIDRFGNLTTNIDAGMLSEPVASIRTAGVSISRVSQYFDEACEGRPVALVNSFGLLEIAIARGNASRKLGVAPGTRVTVAFA
ncbi:MAG: SAM-dependent chlorinase/fluorinase [Desulfomonilaceae bacterium]|nr:SAM-dependent chlorinase/fluorinase [Desulfomonilaceae bacterium]